MQVVVADVGSKNGTFMAGLNLRSGLGHSDKLKPRNDYTIHDGDVLLCGKRTNIDGRVRNNLVLL